jgi:hypothetical protein
MAEQSRVETGSARAGTAAADSSDRARETVTAFAPETARTDSPKLVPEPTKAETGKAEPARSDASLTEAPKSEAPRMSAKLFATSPINRSKDGKGPNLRVESAKPDTSKVDMSKVEIPRVGGKIAVAPVERGWDNKSANLKVAPEAGKAAQASQQVKPNATPKTATPRMSPSSIAGKMFGSFSSLRSLSLGSFSLSSFSLGSSSGDRSWALWKGKSASPKPETPTESAAPERSPMKSLAAMVALAAAAGAVGGALATSALTQFSAFPVEAATTSDNTTLEASVARIDADLQALKSSGTDQTSQPGQIQGVDNQTSERLDRLERAEAESSAKIVRLNDTTERLRAAMQSTPGMAAVAPPPPAPRDPIGSASQTTGSASSLAARPTTPPKADSGKLPIVQGWSLRDVSHGVAVIEGRNGFYEVYAGDPIPGLGRVDAIRRQDGRWVVVTSKGLVVSR